MYSSYQQGVVHWVKVFFIDPDPPQPTTKISQRKRMIQLHPGYFVFLFLLFDHGRGAITCLLYIPPAPPGAINYFFGHHRRTRPSPPTPTRLFWYFILPGIEFFVTYHTTVCRPTIIQTPSKYDSYVYGNPGLQRAFTPKQVVDTPRRGENA